MADLSLALDEALLSDLECSACMEYMVPPVIVCFSGHHICSKCGKKENCPTCQKNFSGTKCKPLESIFRRQKFPCANRDWGCLDLFSIEQIAEHQAVCTYGRIPCPINKVNMQCHWKGFKSQLRNHARTAHPINLIHESKFFSGPLENQMALLLCFEQVFLYNKEVRDGRLSCVVQLIGPRSKASKYKCEFELRGAYGIERINKTFTVRSYAENFEESFSSRKCFCLDDVEVRNFVVDDKLDLTITLSRVQ